MDSINSIEIYNNIYKMIIDYHNPKLIIPTSSPNDNFITHIYSDGEITEQKGGFAYLQRNERTIEFPIKNMNIDSGKFPIIRDIGRYVCGYAIVNTKNAYEIRNEMLKLIKK